MLLFCQHCTLVNSYTNEQNNFKYFFLTADSNKLDLRAVTVVTTVTH